MKTQKRRWLSVLLVLAMLVTACSTAVLADDAENPETPDAVDEQPQTLSGTCGDNLQWAVDENHTLTISGSGAMTDYDGENPAPWPTDIEQLVLSSGVTKIGGCAFRNCASLTAVQVPTGVSIGAAAFKGCSGLADHDGNVVVNQIYFDYVGNDEEIIVPYGVKEISMYAFSGCDGKSSIMIYPTVLKIDRNASLYCYNVPKLLLNGSSADFQNIQIDDTGLNSIRFADDLPGEKTDSTNGAMTLAHYLRNCTGAQIPGYPYAVSYESVDTDGSTYTDRYYTSILLDEAEHLVIFSEIIDLDDDDVYDANITMGINYLTNKLVDIAIYLTDEADHVKLASSVVNQATFTKETELGFGMIAETGYEDYVSSSWYELNTFYNEAAHVAFEDWRYLVNAAGLKMGHLGFLQYENYTGNTVAGPAHCWDEGVVTEPATCDARGVRTYTCTLDGCGATRTEPIPRTEHNWDAGTLTTPMTDTQDGVITYTCTICGEEKTDMLPAGGSPYLDMQSSSVYYYTSVLWAAEQGITSGTSAFTFSPSNPCTRAQIVSFLWRAAGKPEPEATECPFTDVKPGAYYYKAVLWAAEQGITSGTSETTFSPNRPCTRAQCVTFLWRYEQEPAAGEAENPFTDVAEGQYYYWAVQWAVTNRITAGMTPTSFAPNSTCTRAQIVTFLWRDLVQSRAQEAAE